MMFAGNDRNAPLRASGRTRTNEYEQAQTVVALPDGVCPGSPTSGACHPWPESAWAVGLPWSMEKHNDVRGVGLEEGRQEIAKRARDTGATEEEARILYHLDEVGKLFYELPGITEVDLTTSGQHVSSLVRMLASRVAEREHPEGWFFSKCDEQSI